MRRPHLSTGAWICTGLISAAVIAPATVYAAASITKVNLVNGSHTAGVTAQHQLLTTPIPPTHVIRAVKQTPSANTFCLTVYTPPAGKAIVVTSVVYDLGSGSAGSENFGGLFDRNCDDVYDQVDTVQAYDTFEHTFPTGLPMNGVALNSSGGIISVYVYGYLIDASSLP